MFRRIPHDPEIPHPNVYAVLKSLLRFTEANNSNLADELSMHLLTTPLLFRLLTFQASPQKTRLIGGVLLTLFTIVMVVHMVMDEFIVHATSFGLAVLTLVIRTTQIIPQQITDPILRKKLRTITTFGVCTYFRRLFVTSFND